MNRNLKFAVGEFVVFMAGAGLCKLVAMTIMMGVMLAAAALAAYGIYRALPRKTMATAPVGAELEPKDMTREFLVEHEGKLAEDDGIVFTS